MREDMVKSYAPKNLTEFTVVYQQANIHTLLTF